MSETLSETTRRAALALKLIGYSDRFVRRVLLAADRVEETETVGRFNWLVQYMACATVDVLSRRGRCKEAKR